MEKNNLIKYNGSIDSVSTKIFWGLLLTFFRINIFNWHLDTILPLLGIILLTVSAWQLQHEAKQFKYILIVGCLHLIIMVVGFTISCTKLNLNVSIQLWSILLNSVLLIATLCWLFSGLSQVTEKALGSQSELIDESNMDTQNLEIDEEISSDNIKSNEGVAQAVYRCCFHYNCIYVAILFTLFIPVIFIITLPLVLILIILILVRVNRALKVIKESDISYQVQRLSLRFYFIGASFLLISIIVCFSTMYYVNSPVPKSHIFVQNDNHHQDEANLVRKQMLNMNFDPEILNSLPDSEVMRYQNMQFCQIQQEDKQIDGGLLRLSICTASFEQMKMRVLLYYNWIKPPHHNYTDVISYNLSQDLVVPNNDCPYSSRLAEVSGKTYEISEVENNFEPFYKAMKFRLWGNKYNNQKGYIAFDLLWADASSTCINIMMDYLHQSSMFNVPYRNNIDMNKNKGFDNMMFDLAATPESKVFQNESFMTIIYSNKSDALNNK